MPSRTPKPPARGKSRHVGAHAPGPRSSQAPAAKPARATSAARQRPQDGPAAAKVGETPSSSPHQAGLLTAAELADLRTQVDDLAGAAMDQVLPLGRRRLGRRTARRTIMDAYRKASQLFTLAGTAGERAT